MNLTLTKTTMNSRGEVEEPPPEANIESSLFQEYGNR